MATKKPKKEDYYHKIFRLGEEAYEALNADEKRVFDMICDTWNNHNYPEDFYTSRTPEEVNEFYGGSGKNTVTKKLYDALSYTFEYNLILDEIAEVYSELPEEEEDEEYDEEDITDEENTEE